MYQIKKKVNLTPISTLMEVYAPRIAAAALPGQFLIVRTDEKGERVPLTICDYDREAGTVTIVTQIIGASSRSICALEEGDSFVDMAGPLGVPSEFVEKKDLQGKRYLFIAGGLGVAPVYPQVKWLHEHGACCDVILGAKNAQMVILEKEIGEVVDNLHICTDDGSKGFHGLVTDRMKALLDGGQKYDQAVAIGPMIMMKFTTLAAKPYGLPLIVSLNTLMVDGTGMCG
ncbi:MAG: sulfide/dihydroorotate dehydrogenase-like FAD/NAD-binding protein, partial [Bacteroidales bacterium]|nr:sulfide/dihydroorotate dehydrogenase-like FAD/NAD-binding protein [Bacteroidales bacterium]